MAEVGYPDFAERLAEFLSRIVQSDRKIARVNQYVPSGAERLLDAELVARGLKGLVWLAADGRRAAGCGGCTYLLLG